MSFKNALKNMITGFSTVWALLLYVIVFAAVIAGLSLPFLLPVFKNLAHAGVITSVKDAIVALFSGGGWNGFTSGLLTAYRSAVSVFKNDGTVASLTISFIVAIVVVGFRFILGLHELPLATVVDGRMSCNAKYGFCGKFFSTLGVSIRYSFFKMLFTVAYDCAVFGIVYGVKLLMGFNVAFVMVAILLTTILFALRSSLIACWAPSVACGNNGVIRGFVRSVRICFKNFGSIFSVYFVSVLLFFALGTFFVIFTLGVAIVIVVPMAMSFFAYLNATEFYGKTLRRYYVDGVVVGEHI